LGKAAAAGKRRFRISKKDARTRHNEATVKQYKRMLWPAK
jgi:hypothetical protein